MFLRSITQKSLLFSAVGFLILLMTLLVGMQNLSHRILAASPASSTASQWYMVDTHVHSTIGADTYVDIGITAQTAKDLGYNAIFLTDHHNGSGFQIGGQTANSIAFDDKYTRWTTDTYNYPATFVHDLIPPPINPYDQGDVKALRLEVDTNNDYGESFMWTKRGPNFRSGDILLDVDIYPEQIDPDAGVYVSVSIGGDPTINKTLRGYTTDHNQTPVPNKSLVLVWQFGNARSPSYSTDQKIFTHTLPLTVGTWSRHQINISDALEDIFSNPAYQNERPMDHAALTALKMAVGATDGTAKVYFDNFKVSATAPVDAADEFDHRTDIIGLFDTANYKTLPAFESGQTKHAQNFNFGITDPSQYFSQDKGADNIPNIQASGYAAQLNHPTITIDEQEVIATGAHGADIMEVRRDEWVGIWDQILMDGVQLIGSWSSDVHRGLTSGKSATYIYAPGPNLQFDSLMKAFFEGRVYNARNDFPGRVLFNLDSNSPHPHPARYPIYISDSLNTVDVSLNIDDGLSSSWKVEWIRNGDSFFMKEDPENSYADTQSVVVNGEATTFVRAEVRSGSNSIKALTQPIFFIDIAGLPVDKRIHIDDIVTSNNRDYHKLKMKGITDANWSTVSELLQVEVENPVDALVRLKMTTNNGPQQVKVDGLSIGVASSLSDFDMATTSSWFYDNANQLLHLKVLHASATAQLNVEFGGEDVTPPTAPTNVNATTVHLGRVDLSWTAATDDVAVAGYTVTRNDELLTTLGNVVSYVDTDVEPDTSYDYVITAFDTANLFSPPSATGSATTPTSSVLILPVVADSYIHADHVNTNFGTSPVLRADTSPDTRSYLRFDLQELAGFVHTTTLQLYAQTNSSIGYSVYEVDDSGWVETEITYNESPSIGSQVGASGAYAKDSWAEANVSSFTIDDGFVTLAVRALSSTGLKFTSREPGTDSPRLVVMASATPPDTSQKTFTPVADAYVNSGNSTTNYGRSRNLRTDAGPTVFYQSFLRFDVQNLDDAVEQATLRVYAETGNGAGIAVHDVSDDSWIETAVNYATAPTIGASLDSVSSVSGGSWIELDVTSVIVDEGLASFALTSPSNTNTRYASRETTSGNRPELVVKTQQGGAAASVTRDVSNVSPQLEDQPIPSIGTSENHLYLPLIMGQAELQYSENRSAAVDPKQTNATTFADQAENHLYLPLIMGQTGFQPTELPVEIKQNRSATGGENQTTPTSPPADLSTSFADRAENHLYLPLILEKYDVKR